MWCPEHLVAVVADIVKIRVPEDYVKKLWHLANFCILCVGLGLIFIGIALPVAQELYFKTSYQFLGYDLSIPRMVLCAGLAAGGVFFCGVALFGLKAMLSDKINSIIMYGRLVFAISVLKAGAAVCVLGGVSFGVAVYFFYTPPSRVKHSIEVIIAYFVMIGSCAVMVFAAIEFASSTMALYASILIKERLPAR